MKVIVFGANGRVGQLVVKQLLEESCTVKAVVHRRNPFSTYQNLQIISADIYQPDQYIAAIEGCDVVVSTLGSWGTPKKDILATGMQHIIPAMQQYEVKRIVSLTGADARAANDTISCAHRLGRGVLRLFAKKILLDGEKHIQALEASDLNWTVVRSPIMTEKGKSHFSFTSKRPYPWQTIRRENVASAIVSLVSSASHLQEAPFVVED